MNDIIINKKRRVDRYDKVITLLIVIAILFIILPSYNVFFSAAVFSYLTLFISFISYIISLWNHPINKRIILYEVLFFLVLSILNLFSTLYNNNSGFTYFIWNFKYFFIILCLIKIKVWNVPILVFFAIFSLFFINCIINKINIRDITLGVSRNIISIHCILIVFLLYISLNIKNNSLLLSFAILILFLIVVWTGSRSGILAFLLFVFYAIISILKYIIRIKIWKKICLFFFLTFSILFIINFFELKIIDFDYYLRMLSEKEGLSLLDDVRFNIITDYIDSLDLMSFIFGQKFSDVAIINYFNGNPHNSFIYAHGNYGFVFLIVIIILIISSLISLIKKKNFLAIILLVSLLRMFSDICAFYGILDIIVYYIIFKNYYFKKELNYEFSR